MKYRLILEFDIPDEQDPDQTMAMLTTNFDGESWGFDEGPFPYRLVSVHTVEKEA